MERKRSAILETSVVSKKGNWPTWVILAKDPFQDIRNTNTVRYVTKNGQLFDGDTLDEVWPSQKAMAKSWWSSDGVLSKITEPKSVTLLHDGSSSAFRRVARTV